MKSDISRTGFFIHLLIWISVRELHHHTSGRSDDLPSQKNILQVEGIDFITESQLDVVTAVSRLFWIVTFYFSFLMAIDIDHTAVNTDDIGFELAPSQKLSEEFEIDFPKHLGGLVADFSQKPRYRFRFFDPNIKFINQGIALQQAQSF